jgi:hypothetical protein
MVVTAELLVVPAGAVGETRRRRRRRRRRKRKRRKN